MSIPRWIHRREPNLVPVVQPVWQLSQIWICDPITPQMPPGVLRGELYLAYVHSQTNRQTCTKCRANRSSRLTASQDFWMCDPLNPPPRNVPCDIEGRLVCPFPNEFADVNQSWCQSVQPFDSFPRRLNCWPSKTPKCPPPPRVSRGNLFGVYPFPDGSADVCQIWCKSVQSFDSFPKLLYLWPPRTPRNAPGVLRGELDLAYVYSQTYP